jgi:lipopolysaccharide/colanic/teichoic acid biosynthesis glycosyltransferase
VLQGANVLAEVTMPELIEFAPKGLGIVGGSPTIVVARGPLGIFDRALKRAFDLAFATAATLLFAPALLLVALAIKLDSRGPVFFLQDRVGRGNATFKVIKFRSMRAAQTDHAGHASTGRKDDRITRVGRIIRASSVDELPQLFNVLIGNMSIVGPRPHALGSRAEGSLFWEIDSRYRYRHAAKPGLTGLAQVRGYRGATNVRSDLTERLGADLEYLNGWSIWRDVKIILLTFRVVFHSNAY